MLFESIDYRNAKEVGKVLESSVFKYCSFQDIALEGMQTDAVMLGCKVRSLNWYWGLFNCCLIADTRFESCVFRGTSFSSCRFLNCEFIGCSFEQDSFGGLCQFDDTQWYGGKAAGCSGLPGYAFAAGGLRRVNDISTRI